MRTEILQTSLGIAVEDRVPDTTRERQLGHICVVMKNYTTNREDTINGSVVYNYKSIRTQRRSVNAAIKKHKLLYPRSTELIKFRSPNAINAINRLKECDGVEYKNGSSNFFNMNGITEEQFKELFEDVVVIEKSNV